MESDHTKQSKSKNDCKIAGNSESIQQNQSSSTTKRQRLLNNSKTTSNSISQQNSAIINSYDHLMDNKNAIIIPKISLYRDRTEEELSIWQESEMQRCYDENFLNYHVQFLINGNDDDVYDVHMQIQNVEESAVSMAINEHGLHGKNVMDESSSSPLTEQSNTRIVLAVRPVPTKSIDTNISNNIPVEQDSSDTTETQPLNDVILENYDFMEAAVAAAIQRNGLFPYR